MTDFHDNIDIEELKKFFLNEALLLCPFVSQEKSEKQRLSILFNTLKKLNILLEALCHTNVEMHYMDVSRVFGFYLTEKVGEERRKHRMSANLNAYGQFMFQLIKLKELVTCYYFYNTCHLSALVHVMQTCYPNDFKVGEINEIGIKELLSKGNGK